jgi:ABC-type branched-subunit amino acid transport system substrate-binding protein
MIRLRKAKPWRIGLSANLSVGESVHRRTFLNAVGMASQTMYSASHAIEFHSVCDGADAERAERAARILRTWDADVVIGHYASAAANAASAVYRGGGIPLLLPAATADALVEPGGLVFRVCDPDRSLARAIVDDLHDVHSISALGLQHDGSLHGKALSADIAAAAAISGIAVMDDMAAMDGAEAVLFAGQYPASVAFLRAHAALSPRLWVLTDDAVSPQLAQDLAGFGRGVLLYGFCPPSAFPSAAQLVSAHRERYGYAPGVYFLETHAALEIVCQYLQQDANAGTSLPEALQRRTWSTVLGTIRFIGNEGGAGRYGRWKLEADRLRYEKRLAVSEDEVAVDLA